jgi:DNA excision repair protein ERCC-4
MWLLSPAAEVLFKKAKERIYMIKKGKSTALVPNPVSRLIPVLEGNPKWNLLGNLLGRIRNEESQFGRKRPATVLIVVKDERTAEGVRSYLVEGRDRTMALQWLRYLESYNDRSRSVANCKISEESRLLLEEEQRVRRKLFGKQGSNNNSSSSKRRGQQLNEVPAYIRKRRRIAVEKGRGQLTESTHEDRERKAVLHEALEETEHDLESAVIEIQEDKSDTDDNHICRDMFQTSLPGAPRVVINTLAQMEGGAASICLWDLEPNYVILYDSDIAFVRILEVYSAMRGSIDKLKVHFLIFQGSAEQKIFSSSIEREQSAFERLIHHKQNMPPPVLSVEGTQEMQHAIWSGSACGSYNNGKLPMAFDSRKARKSNDEKRNIAVDVREFRSALPSILHQGGMRLAPVTLTVGDFVLSKVHCVERKSISDLFGSFASGRLYTQVEHMSKYYKCPCLLIEFDPTKSFCLQNSNELGVDIKNDSVCSKIVLLTSHFHKLRILWSKSPHETLKVFRELKSNHEDVDVDLAMEFGRDESAEALLQAKDDSGEEDEINEAARDMLLRLPGVNVHSAGRIMRECDSIAELAEMDRMELRRIAGPVTGQKLFRFFRQTLAAT